MTRHLPDFSTLDFDAVKAPASSAPTTITWDTPEGIPHPSDETGRSAHVPVGLKEWRLMGAFRTPTLRNLALTGPYLHNGEEYAPAHVVDFFDKRVNATTHLAAALKDGDEPRKLNLRVDEKDALVMFLRALEGTPVDPIVTKVDR